MKRWLAWVLAVVMLFSYGSALAETMAEKYLRAVELVAAGDYAKADELLSSFGSYEDSARLGMYCKAILAAEQGQYDLAQLTFSSLGDSYRDCKYLIVYYQARQMESNAGSGSFFKGESLLSASDLYMKIPMFKDSMERSANCYKAVYQYASECASNGAYSTAAYNYELLNDYLDSKNRSQQARADGLFAMEDLVGAFSIYKGLPLDYRTHAEDYANLYNAAVALKDSEAYVDAAEAFRKIMNYEDAEALMMECQYQQAEIYRTSGEYEQAIALNEELGEYRDCKIRLIQISADQLYDEGKLAEASALYKTLEPAYHTHECRYQIAKGYYDRGSYDTALVLFEKYGLEGYQETNTMMLDSYYQQGLSSEQGKDYASALGFFSNCADYLDTSEHIKACHYQTALQEIVKGKPENALERFEKTLDYADSKQRIFDLGEYYRVTEQYDLSLRAFSLVTDMEETIPILYEIEAEMKDSGASGFGEDLEGAVHYLLGETAFSRQDLKKAFQEFEAAGDYQDAVVKVQEIHYILAEAALKDNDFDTALKEFEAAGNYSDALTRIQQVHYDLGNMAYQEENYNLAITEYELAGGYSDSAERILGSRYAIGMKALTEGDYDEAKSFFEAAGNYKDAPEQIKESLYQKAISQMKSSKYSEAYTIFMQIAGYKDTIELMYSDEKMREKMLSGLQSPESLVFFGHYEQDGDMSNGSEPIVWIVLDVKDGKSLLFSKYALDAQPYNTEDVGTTWEKCSLRKWLNNEFLNAAFDKQEQKAIQQTSVDNSPKSGYSEYKTKGGNNTRDKVFLLSFAEAKMYFGLGGKTSNTKSLASPTAYAKARGAATYAITTEEGEARSVWWLRSPGFYNNYASHVYYNGSIISTVVNTASSTVRPAIWVNQDSDIFKSGQP